MTQLETPSELHVAFDALLARAHRQLRLYDHDLSLLALDQPQRHAALRALCVAGAGHRIELLLDDIHHIARDCPRLMQLVRDFSHVIEIRQADPDAPRPEQAFVVADDHSALIRADKAALRGVLHLDDASRTVNLHRSFESMWQRSQTHISATTLGL
ncbi:MAG: hypothetical protein B7Z35_11905 [Hydrogenophilales bacterium 12-61-10]|nr:MAG: hypothetical protein B7Z35_11905 [Hydrogenophilales bacterium 12-61-10]OYX28409.1 MAG: hypothetical protein B7Z03_11675 [Hydrogenophilales bacterium 32-62-9]